MKTGIPPSPGDPRVGQSCCGGITVTAGALMLMCVGLFTKIMRSSR